MSRETLKFGGLQHTQRLSGFVLNPVVILLRIEGFAVLAVSIFAFYKLGGGLAFFLLTFLVPDASMAGYLIKPSVGAACHNAAHTYLLAGALALMGLLTATPAILTLAAVWAAHIGFDRALGYGLKYPDSFEHTHLGPIGKLRRAPTVR